MVNVARDSSRGVADTKRRVEGFYNYSTKATAPGLGVANVDIVSDHGSPRNVALMNSEIPLAANAKKARPSLHTVPHLY